MRPITRLLTQRSEVKNIGIIAGDRAIAAWPAHSTATCRALAFNRCAKARQPVRFVTIGKKGRDFIYRRGGQIVADFSGMPARPTLLDTTPATRTIIDDFLERRSG